MTELCSFWILFERSLPPACQVTLTIKTDDVTSGTRDVDRHGWLGVVQAVHGLIVNRAVLKTKPKATG